MHCVSIFWRLDRDRLDTHFRGELDGIFKQVAELEKDRQSVS